MQPIAFQVVADAEDPHGLARFWADALGWTLEDNDAFVRSALKAGYATGDDVVELDGRKFWRTVAAIRHPDDPYHPQRGYVGREHINTTVSRLRDLGATELYQVDEPGAFHTTMQDPEGNEFCVQ